MDVCTNNKESQLPLIRKASSRKAASSKPLPPMAPQSATMPAKRKLSDAEPEHAVPPSLPPSVEEAYRRKCVQLKNRTNEVEDANDAARLRLARIKRQVEKLRIERAFLLEQLAKRTSTNVEDSDGSPSPPPTDKRIDVLGDVDANPRKPKERPLRTKRGHRKPSAVGDGDSSKAPDGESSKQPASPGSESQSHAVEGGAKEDTAANDANGTSSPTKAPTSGFELFCVEARLKAKEKDDEAPTDEELSQAWKDLADDEKAEIKARYNREFAERAEDEDHPSRRKKDDEPATEKQETQDEDVEMGNYDTEDQEAQADKDGDE
ncbi:hypothetical protein HJFPF1_02923 [Paramyrothecium foliicola]|nr:hypothetical protein HJFPF1_02923 [Paramyrothecium foliicola]